MLGTRVTFPTQGKSPKVRQGLCPLESPGACSPPFSRSLRCAPTRAGLLSANTPDRFATLNLWANRSFFLPKLYRGSHFLLSIRGAAVRFDFCGLPGVSLFLGGAALAAAGGMIIAPQGEYPEGDTPLGDSLVTFSSGRKSPGCRAERLHRVRRDFRPCIKAPGCRAERLPKTPPKIQL